MEAAMFQVMLECEQSWPESGPFRVEAHFTREITVSPAVARRRAGGFLGMEVTMMALAGTPVLVLSERPVWRVPAHFTLPGLGEVATIGSIDVDAHTSEVIPPSSNQIAAMQNRADAIAARLASPAAVAL